MPKLTIVLTIILFASIAIIIMIGLRKREPEACNDLLLPIPSNTDSIIPHSNRNIESPILSCTFEEALSSTDFLTDLQRCTLLNLNNRIISEPGDAGSITFQSIRMLESKRELVVRWSRGGEKLINEGKAKIATQFESGKKLPFLRSTEDGKVMEMMKGVSKSSARLAQVSALVVSSAHIISGADLAKKIELVSKDVKFLVAVRQIDQMSKLEGLYAHARAIISNPINESAISELRHISEELTNLRSQWRREVGHVLHQVQDPSKRNWFKRKLSRNRTQDRKVLNQVTPLARQMALIDFSLQLELAVSDVIGSGSYFLFNVLPEEMNKLKLINEEFRNKLTYITRKSEYELQEATRMLGYCERVHDKYGSFLPESAPIVGV
jgi:hypothetical protein